MNHNTSKKVLSLYALPSTIYYARHNTFEYRQYRFMAYRQLTGWCWGWLGRRTRVTLPSCAVNKIRTKFPSSDGNYTGFKYPPFTWWCTVLTKLNIFLLQQLSWIILPCYSHDCTSNYKLNLLLWLLMAVGLSGLSYWLLRGPGVSLGSISMIPSVQRLKVSFIRSSM